ncbi:hypothetical protein [Candidatus Thiodictyon syntrophicum]|jgi:hypothetical protein|uniref:Uncharacterized protein n=1 Tax=Candidatus Thiodictyon syntrophicum TaxID=1166950 RepID=A0A2K8UEX3_9GAMM|nr:hypothetical protein [Candidatus Thiodictyon syntrophicum]AUB84134.1 hypothetical protein THSYN_26490 [Candidatus Thiodictyon syntrophicum]
MQYANAFFMEPHMLKMVGTSGQVSLGKQYVGRYFEMQIQADGGILLKPVRVIPEADAWLYTPEMRERLAQAAAWMAEHPPRETDLEQLAARVEGGE